MTEPRCDWRLDEVRDLFELPLFELLYRAHGAHREHFPHHQVQISTLLSIKTGACPEDCAYCPQSIRFDTGLEAEALMDVDGSRVEGAGWPSATRRDPLLHGRGIPLAEALNSSPQINEMVPPASRALGLETCATLGMLTDEQAELAGARPGWTTTTTISTAPSAYYPEIITTRTYADRLQTLQRGTRRRAEGLLRRHRRHGRDARGPRRALLRTLANLPVASGKRADQPSGARARVRRWPTPIRWTRWSSSARSRSPAS
jgi:biotin synthase